MKHLLVLTICFSMILTSCSDVKNLPVSEKENAPEELFTTREFEVDGTTYIDYINAKGITEFTMGGDLINKK